MRSFILVLLAVFLTKPCLAQQMSKDFDSSVLSINQPYSSLNGDFNDISEVLYKTGSNKSYACTTGKKLIYWLNKP